MSERKFGVTTYYIGDQGSFDTAIDQLMPQINAGLSVNIRRLDGVQCKVSVTLDSASRLEHTPYWMRHESVCCDLCRISWKGGYIGLDAEGAIQSSICYDCADVLLRLQLGVTKIVVR